jgi:hypothetical protein
LQVCQSNIESLSYTYQFSGYTSVGCIFDVCYFVMPLLPALASKQCN